MTFHTCLEDSRIEPQTERECPDVFFGTLLGAFERARKSNGNARDHFYRIAGFLVRLRFAGAVLAPIITPALEHLACKGLSAEPDLTICLWDSSSSGVRMPPPPWSTDDYLARAEVRGYSGGRFRTAYQLDAGVLSMLDVMSGMAVYWARDVDQLPGYISGSPMMTILHWWMREHGRQLVHAGAVGTKEGGVLLAGRGGSGKSSTALACLNSELLYVSDDYCLVSSGEVPYVHSLYSSAKLDANGLQRFPELASVVHNLDRLESEKALLFLQRHRPQKLIAGFPIRAVLVPRITGKPETALAAASPVAGLKALAPSTIFQLSGAGHSALESVARLVRQVPCYYLDLGTDIPAIPRAIFNLLTRG